MFSFSSTYLIISRQSAKRIVVSKVSSNLSLVIAETSLVISDLEILKASDVDSTASLNKITLYWSDDDYQNWSNGKEITLTDDFPNFSRLGSFRRRAFRIIHEMNTPFRVESMEIDFTEGGH